MTAIHFATDPVPVLPSAPAAVPRGRRLLERFLNWVDEGLAELDSED